LGIPAQGSGKVLYYNTTWARELGFDTPPETPQAFRQQACAAAGAALRDNDLQNDHKGGWIVSIDYTAVLGWIYATGGDVVAPGGARYTFDTPEAAQAFTFLRDLLDRGCAWLSESQVPEAEFAGRLGLFATGSVAGIPQQEEAFVTAGSQDEWAAVPFPAPEGNGVMPVYGASFQVFQATPEEQLASWLLIKYLTDPQQQAELAQITSQFPVRASALDRMGVLPAAHPQWQAALELIPEARHEPALPSWRLVRWAVSDAATQLFRYYFEVGQVSTLVRLLNTTANDLNDR
jgi:ABC-type glycerol-3-phosphate transport system substrate-binding protein